MEGYLNTYNTISFLSNNKNYELLKNDDKKALVSLKKKLDKILINGMIFTGVSSFIYIKISKHYIKRNIIQKSIDLIFVLLFTKLTTELHNKQIIQIYKTEIEPLKNKYKFILKNTIIFNEINNYHTIKENENILNYVHRFNNKYTYFILYLTFRILFK
jgi:hypothetical protein